MERGDVSILEDDTIRLSRGEADHALLLFLNIIRATGTFREPILILRQPVCTSIDNLGIGSPRRGILHLLIVPADGVGLRLQPRIQRLTGIEVGRKLAHLLQDDCRTRLRGGDGSSLKKETFSPP